MLDGFNKSGSLSKIRTWTWQIQSLLHYRYAKRLYYGAASLNRTEFSPSSEAREHQLHQGGIKSIAIWFYLYCGSFFKSTRPFAHIASFIHRIIFSLVIIGAFFIRSLSCTFAKIAKDNIYFYWHVTSFIIWYLMTGLNRRPSPCKRVATSAELIRH